MSQDCDPEPFLAFVPPILADSAYISMQIFFQSKFLLNQASAYLSYGFFLLQLLKQLINFNSYKCITGSFLKTTAEDLKLNSYEWDTTMVKIFHT